MQAGENPRFVVTSLPAEGFQDDPPQEPEAQPRFGPARLYEELYCARGEMENLLKQQVLDLRADRMSTHYLASNQFRLWEASSIRPAHSIGRTSQLKSPRWSAR